ncbi:MAG: major facilitator superfamily 1, partial [Frankiales bacterium]|nr:major facilitator superfamily 1 [Frankiales bacterium]
MSLFTRYGALLRGTGAGPALAASLLGRLALGTTGLALLLLVRDRTGSYAVAGAVSAAYAVSFAAFAPVRARSADRRGPRRVLLLCGLLHPLVLGGLVLLADGPRLLLVLAAVVAGATVPPLGGVMRALWVGLAGTDPRVDLTTAYSLESVVVELCFVGGPLLVAVLSSTLGPEAAVLAAGLLVLAGGLGLAATPAVRLVVPHPDARKGSAGPLSSAAVRSLLVTIACVGSAFGAVDVAVVAFADVEGGRPSTGAVLVALGSVGSIVGGLVYGAVHSQVAAERQLPFLVTAFAVSSALPLLAPGVVPMGALLLAWGLTIAPYSTCNSVLLSRASPPGTVTEAFAWSGSALFGGAALGNVVSG